MEGTSLARKKQSNESNEKHRQREASVQMKMDFSLVHYFRISCTFHLKVQLQMELSRAWL